MPASLLPSQLATLEPPGAEEAPLAVDVAQAPDVLVLRLVEQLRAPAS
jgi:gluconokinase